MSTQTQPRTQGPANRHRPLTRTVLLWLAVFSAGVGADDALKLYDRHHVPDPHDVAKMLQVQRLALHEQGHGKTRGISLDRPDSLNVEDALARQSEQRGAFAVQINFALNSAEVGGDFIPHIEAIAKGIKLSGPDTRIAIEGHTDASGTEVYNDELSLRRAQAVRALLIEKYGVDADRIAASGYGPRHLADAADPYSGKNRRVQFRALQ
jgi:outer membrane protein OmpA-like peptidoglycan-associated protein